MNEILRYEQGAPKARAPHYLIMKKIVSEMQEHPSAWPFLVPVSGVPDYYNVIKEPMGIFFNEKRIAKFS
jgi:histone acetyltransferase